jgi:hypothetical protein
VRGAEFRSSPKVNDLLRSRLATATSRHDTARRSIIKLLTQPGDRVGVPATASRVLVDAVKVVGRQPIFCPIDRWGAPTPIEDIAMLWVQTIAGQPPPIVGFHGPVALDAATTVGIIADPKIVSTNGPMHVDSDRQIERVQAVAAGVIAAAGLDVLPVVEVPSVLPTGVALRLSHEADAPTFFSYATAELTGLVAEAHVRPLHPLARLRLTPEQLRSSVHNLERIFVIHVGPDFTDEEVGHSVLGVVKTAEYTGWRWCTDRPQATWYSHWLNDRYGIDHEAYRPAFALT